MEYDYEYIGGPSAVTNEWILIGIAAVTIMMCCMAAVCAFAFIFGWVAATFMRTTPKKEDTVKYSRVDVEPVEV